MMTSTHSNTHQTGYSTPMDLSFQLPRQTKPFGNRHTQVFFENLLPDGHIRQILAEYRVLPHAYQANVS